MMQIASENSVSSNSSGCACPRPSGPVELQVLFAADECRYTHLTQVGHERGDGTWRGVILKKGDWN